MTFDGYVQIGNQRVSAEDLLKALDDGEFTLFGMDLKTLLEFRRQYLTYFGRMPINEENVKELFNRIARP